jgi:hypothetical protein
MNPLAPLVTAPGGRFVLRTGNDGATLGGGIVLGILSGRIPRNRPDVEEQWPERLRSSPLRAYAA